MQPQKSDKWIWLFLLVLGIFSVGSFVFVQYEISGMRGVPVAGSQIPATPIDACGPNCQAYVNKAIGDQLKVATPSSTSTPGAKTQVINQTTSPKITYIPLSGGSTQNTGWTDITSTTFTLSIGDYGSKASAVWDANIRVDNASGATYARVFDKTHGITVNGSEINVANTSTSTDVTSGALQFWNGNNTYVVQLKSLNGSTAFLDSARIRISY